MISPVRWHGRGHRPSLIRSPIIPITYWALPRFSRVDLGSPYRAVLLPARCDVQAQPRPAVPRQGARHCGLVSPIRRTVRWYCAWMRRVRSKLSIAPRRCCPCAQDRSSAAPTTTSATAPPSVRRTRYPFGQDHRPDPATPPLRGVPQLARYIEKNVPEELDVHLILDNYGTKVPP
jgi:hypothetical protein